MDRQVEDTKTKKTVIKDFDDEICKLLKTVATHFDQEDRMTRERQIRHMRRLKLYWNNFSQIYWSEVAHDYRIYNRDINATDTDQDYYDKPVNIFKAFLETIIAALSIQIPAINCVPDDAENPLDMLTAEAGDKISELIYKHNDVLYLWLHSLYIYCTEGMIACYSYSHKDKKYGTRDVPKFKDEEIESYVCKQCGARIPDEMVGSAEEDEDNKQNEQDNGNCGKCEMFIPGANRCSIHGPQDDIQQDWVCDYFEEGQPGSDGDQSRGEVTKEQSNYRPSVQTERSECLECGAPVPNDLEKTKIKIPRLDGVTKEPKSRICLEVYGGLYVKVANYAKKAEDIKYLIFMYETHYSNALECYKNLREEIPHGGWSNSGVNDPYEQYGRLNTQYRGEFPDEQVTVKNCWLEPATFNVLPDDDYKKLKAKFPNGVRFVMVNDIPAEYEPEHLHDHWTVTDDPMHDFVTKDALGELLTNIQDVVNDLISLTLQTIEHGIAQTWADPGVVNFTAQKQIEAMPGTLTPTKPISASRRLADAFHSTQLASLSPEVMNFYKIIQELGQFVSGALPSIFGGNQQAGSSRTASEYAMSKGMALQRLQTPWRMMTTWWKRIFTKVIPMFIDNMEEDERFVDKDEQGKFINVWIRKTEVEGKIGSIELEPDERMPITNEQQADMIMQLFALNNQEINAALMDPENLPYISKTVKIPEFKIPGTDDRQKQYEEIIELINSVPIPPGPPVQGQPPQGPQSSVPIDVDVDNHQIEAGICKSWLISLAGRQAKKDNPNGYMNVLLHMKAHLQQVQIGIQAQQLHSDQLTLATDKKSTQGAQRIKGAVPTAKPSENQKVTGATNANTPVS